MSRKKNPDAPAEPKLSKYDKQRLEQGLPPETKRDKFQRLANRRVPRLLKAMAHVAALSNRSTYDYSKEQAEKIIAALNASLKVVTDRFKGSEDNGTLFRI